MPNAPTTNPNNFETNTYEECRSCTLTHTRMPAQSLASTTHDSILLTQTLHRIVVSHTNTQTPSQAASVCAIVYQCPQNAERNSPLSHSTATNSPAHKQHYKPQQNNGTFVSLAVSARRTNNRCVDAGRRCDVCRNLPTIVDLVCSIKTQIVRD